ncbi:MAG: galactose oxidase-like domain-containing protein [Gemmatimonadales bacterium]
MKRNRADLWLILPALVALFLTGCFDGAQSPRSRPESPQADGEVEGILAPVDLVYLCNNTFLATNSTKRSVHVEYRVVGTHESGGLTLRPGLDQDPGFSETELMTKEPGPVELYVDGERVTHRRNRGTQCGPPAISASVTGMASSESGSWSGPFPLPLVALHVSLLPTGKVLMWDRTTPQVWDPATGNLTSVPSPALLFCSGHSFLADGRLLVSGGHISDDHGLPDNTIFNPGSQTWSRSTPMRRGRWYPTNTTLANGDVVITAGRDEAGLEVEEPEVWSASLGTVRVLTGAKQMLPYYPRAFLAPNGQLFYAGEQQITTYLNPAGAGSWTTVASRQYPVRDYGSAVMYDEGKILYAGGGRTTNTAEIIDLNSASPAWRLTGSMAFPRRHLNATVLPTGEVLVTGGSSGTAFNDWTAGVHAAELWDPATGVWTTLASNTITRTYHAASLLLPDGRILHTGSGGAADAPDQMNAEIFSPPYLFKGPRPVISDAPAAVAYGGSFTVTTPEAADIGKVSLIRLGSVTHAFDMNQRFQWLPFTRGTGELTIMAPQDANRTPPGHYMLFILDGTGVPSVAKIVRVGTTVSEPPPPSISLTATGKQDGAVQYMTLRWSGATGTMVDIYRNGARLRTTANDGSDSNGRTFSGNVTYVFRVCAAGTTTCSNDATVTFGSAPPPNALPTAGFTSSCTDLTCAFTDGSTDSDGTVTAWSWTFGDGATSTVRNPSRTYASAGTYTVGLQVTDNAGGTGQRSEPVTVTAPQASKITLTATGRQDAAVQYLSLKWTGATGAMVDVYRNGTWLRTTANDGSDTNARTFQGAATYVLRVCQAGSTICSNDATVVFN